MRGGVRPGTRGILLDVDGTLFDSFPAILASMNDALEETGDPPLRAGELRPLIGMPVRRQMALLRGMEGPAVAPLRDGYYRHFQRRVEEGIPLFPGVAETLERLGGRAIGTMTTRRTAVARRMLETAHIVERFVAIVGGDQVTRPKPHPDLVRVAAEAIGTRPRECVAVGDAAVDILAGRRAGAWTVAATYGYGALEDLRRAEPHAEIASIGDLVPVLEGLETGAE